MLPLPVVIVVAALAALSLTFKGHSDNSSNDRPSPHQSNISTQLDNNLTPDSQPEEITISATDLWAAYKENTVNADALYKDKILVVTGTIQNIGQDIVTKAPCISIETNDGYGLYPHPMFFPKERGPDRFDCSVKGWRSNRELLESVMVFLLRKYN